MTRGEAAEGLPDAVDGLERARVALAECERAILDTRLRVLEDQLYGEASSVAMAERVADLAVREKLMDRERLSMKVRVAVDRVEMLHRLCGVGP